MEMLNCKNLEWKPETDRLKEETHCLTYFISFLLKKKKKNPNLILEGNWSNRLIRPTVRTINIRLIKYNSSSDNQILNIELQKPLNLIEPFQSFPLSHQLSTIYIKSKHLNILISSGTQQREATTMHQYGEL